MISKYLEIQNVQNVYQLLLIPDLKQTFNNSGSDYLDSSLNFLTASDAILDDIVSKDIQLLDAVLAVEIVVLVCYVSIFILMVYIISRSNQRLCRALIHTQGYVIKQRISQLNKIKTLLEDDIERKYFIQEAFDMFIEERSSDQAKDSGTVVMVHKTTGQSKLKMAPMNKHLLKITLFAFLFIPMFTAMFVTTLTKSVNTFNDLGSYNEQLSELNQGCFWSSVMMSTMVYYVAYRSDPTMLVNNRAPLEQIYRNLNTFNHLNQKLIQTFLSSKDREIDPFLVDILKTNVCRYLDERSKAKCEGLSGNQNMGLLSLNTDYYTTLVNGAATLTSDMTLVEAIKAFWGLLEKLTDTMHVMEEIYPIMMGHVLENFESTVESSRRNEVIFIVVIFVAVIGYTVFLYLTPLKDFQRVDIGRRKILKIIPVGILQENKALKFYLIQDFKNEIDDIKNSL